MNKKFASETKAFLEENYYTLEHTRSLWVQAGGKGAAIHDQQPSKVRWSNLIQQAEQGAIIPTRLVIEALKEFPFNSILMTELLNRVDEDKRNLVIRLLSQNQQQDIIDRDLEELRQLPEYEATAALAAGLVQRVSPTGQLPSTITAEFSSELKLEMAKLTAVGVATIASQGFGLLLQVLGPMFN